MSVYHYDDAFSINWIEALRATWPAETSFDWCKYPNGKLASKTYEQLPQAAKLLLADMSKLIVHTRLDIAEPLFPDVQYLHGAGLHQMNQGVELDQHLDAERHPLQPWRRMVSMVLYLDTCEQGGELDFVDASGNLLQRIKPVKNRVVVFKTARNYHRVRAADSVRRSLCLFFWTVDTTVTGTDSATFK